VVAPLEYGAHGSFPPHAPIRVAPDYRTGLRRPGRRVAHDAARVGERLCLTDTLPGDTIVRADKTARHYGRIANRSEEER
jgi:hypothetical protein